MPLPSLKLKLENGIIFKRTVAEVLRDGYTKSSLNVAEFEDGIGKMGINNPSKICSLSLIISVNDLKFSTLKEGIKTWKVSPDTLM